MTKQELIDYYKSRPIPNVVKLDESNHTYFLEMVVKNKIKFITIQQPSVTGLIDRVIPFDLEGVIDRMALDIMEKSSKEISMDEARNIAGDRVNMGRDRGTCVHGALSFWINKMKFESNKVIDKEIRCVHEPMIKSHNDSIQYGIKQLRKLIPDDFWEDPHESTGINQIMSEGAYWNFEKGYVGSIDLWWETKDNIYVLDFKTNKDLHLDKEYLQLFLYKQMLLVSGVFNDKNKPIKTLILNVNKHKLYSPEMELSAIEKKELLVELKEKMYE